MQIARRFAILVLVVLLGGCATARGPLFDGWNKPKDGNGVVYIYRPWTFVSSAVSPHVYINDESKFKISNGGYQVYNLPAGKYEIKLVYSWYHFIFPVKSQVKIEKGSVVYLRVSNHISYTGVATSPVVTTTTLLTVTRGVALKEIPETKLSM